MNIKVKNNKILKIIVQIIVLIVGLMVLNNKSYAATEVVDGITWTYTASGGNAIDVYTTTTITTSLLTDGTILEVPEKLGGYPVKTVGRNYSSYNIINKTSSASNANSTIKKIQLPTTVTTINQYAFSRLSGLTEVVGMDNVTAIGSYAFYYGTGLKNVEIPSKVTTIGNHAFRYCSALTSVKFNSNITSMGTYLFQNCTKLNTVDFNNYSMRLGNYMFYGVSSLKTILNWDNITSIGTNVFYNCTGLTSITLPSKLTAIGNYAFYGCSNISGDLVIPENVSSIGTYAFQNCSKLDGNIEFKTTKIVSIGNYTFYNCSNVKKVIIPNTVTSVGSNAFYGFKDVWVNANQADSKITFASNFSGTNTAYVHYLDDLHTVEVQVLPGIRIKDLNTGSDFVSGQFIDGTNINIEFVVEDGYNYDNVKVLIEKDGTYKNNGKSYQELNLATGITYTDTNLLRNTKILTLNISNGLDLVARTYIDSINGKALETSREVQFALENCVSQYKHTKYPLIVETGDTVVYKIRVYNEGNIAGTANKIVEYLPTGLDYYKDSKINSNYGWVLSEDGRTVTTEYTKDKNLSAYTGTTDPAYVELEIECIVSQEKGKDKIIRLTNFVEIAEVSSGDVDSTAGNIVIQDSENYKKEDAENSNSGSYVKGEEDDQDFENVLVLRSVPVSYVLKISKVDSEDFKLLNGAKFDLINQNGEVIQSGVTVQNGELVFDRITTYDEGMDVYYISEVETPVGYTNPLEQTIKITVIKTITDQLTESFALEIICDLLETRVDTTIDEDSLVPIYTKEQLKKVGSEEELEIKGITYKLGINNNYRLMENIDISGEEWIPLPSITGVFDGNEKTITGLTITNKNLKEIGLFGKFSGVIDSLTLDNVRINIDLSKELEEIEEKYEDDPEELAIQIENLISPYHIGGLVGSMTGGSIINSTVNGTIYTDSNNVGGFVGYGENGYLTKIKNCTNNATVVTSHSNAGGFVGYSYSALILVECFNNGNIIAEEYNAAGLVGYSEAKDYETSVVKTEFDSQNSIVNLIIGNNKYVGHYSLVLNKLDAGNKQLIDGTKFTVYDENKAVINGLESVEVKNGVLNIGNFEVKTTGVDTYFLKEIEAAKGYDKLQDFIRINVIKSWDGANSRFKFSTDLSNVTVDGFISNEFVSKDEDAYAGAIYNYKQTDTVKWLVNKVVALSCTNNGEIVAGVNASGIFAKTNCGVNIENSINTAKIIAQNHTAGLLSESLKVDKETNVTINNSKNTGEIILNAGKYNYMSNAAGILADTSVYTIIKNSSNEGNVLGTASSVPTYAGIIANVQEDILIENCKNKGQITSQGSTDIAAGILGKIIVEDSIANIKECENTGDITATTIAAGILGQAGGDEFIIKYSSTNNCKIQATSATGGIVGFSSTDAHISDCQTENLTLNANSGSAAAILALEVAANYSFGEVGNTYYYSSSPSLIDIKNISVKNMTLNGNPEDKGAIAGKIVISSNSALENVKFTDCTIEDSNIKTNVAGGYAGMIAGTIQGHHNLDILRCNINNSVIDQGYETNSGSSSNTAMMIGSLRIANNVGDSNINVLDSNIENCSIKLAGAGMVSNIIGYNYSSGKTVTTVRNTNIKSSPIDVKGTGDQKAGNILAGIEQSKELIIDNCDIMDSPIITKTTGSYSEVAALVGHNFNNRFEFTNIDVENSSVASGAGTIGVLAADSYYGASSSGSVYEGKIENCNITNTTVDGQNHNSTYISGATNGGALMGMNRLGIITIKNVNLKSTKEEPDFVFATNTASTGIGYSGYALNVDNFNVDGYQYKAVTGNTQISGVVSVLLNSLELRNSNLTNLKFDTTSNTATIVNYNSGNLIADNLNIKNIDMKNTQTGFVSGFTNLVTGALKLSNSTIDNIKVESNGSGMHVAGLITHLNGNDNNISNCKISNIDVKANGTRHETASGIATIVNGSFVFADNEVSDIKVTGNGVNVSAIVASGRIDTIGTNSDSKTSLNNITLSSDYASGVNMGTVLGVSYDSNGKIQNVTANNVKLSTSSMAPRIGGLLGCAAGTVNNCKVMNSNIESTYSVYNQNNFPIVGGLYGLCSSSANNHSNLTVQNTTIKSNFGYVGGVYGLSQANVEKANVINSNVSALSSGATVGGIIGHDAYNLTISEAKVTDSKISNVGKAVSEISPNIVTIYPTGGIAGFARGLVKDCDVIRTTIETTGTDSYATGGIVGHGFNASTTTHTVIQGCDVTDSTITGANGLGGIAGAAVAKITDCTVQGTETTSTNSLFAEKTESSVVIDNMASEDVKEEVTEEVKEEVTEEVKEEVTEEVKEEVTEEVKEEVIEEVKEEVTEEVKEEVTEEVKEEVTEEVKEEVTEEVKEEITEEVKEEVTEEVKEEVTEEVKEITAEQVEEKIKEDKLLDAIISPIETIQSNIFATELVAKENKSKTSGKKYIGGILGHGGVILDTYAQLTISNCTIKEATIEGTTDVHEDVGVLPSYPTTLVPTVELLNTIIDFVKENVILTILGE